MKTSNVLVMTLASMALMLSACAKQDSDFAAKYAKNGMGAKVTDGAATQRADEYAAENGLQADIVGISKNGSGGDGQAKTITSTILINNQQRQVDSVHYSTEVVEGETEIDGYTIKFHAMCANEACEPYYAMIDVYQYLQNHNTQMIQVGVKKFFDTNGADKYQWFAPPEALKFIGSNQNDIKGMVGFLNKSTTTAVDVK
jgi:hypothetical protein